MRKFILGATGLLVMAVAVGIPGASAATKKHPLSQDFLGAQISASGLKGVTAYQVKDATYGVGAGLQHNVVTGTTFPLSGSDTSIVFFAKGTEKTKDTFKLAAPDANGISAVTGS